MLRGEPLVSKIALLAKYVIFPGAMIASILYCPPDFNKPNKRPFDPAQDASMVYGLLGNNKAAGFACFLLGWYVMALQESHQSRESQSNTTVAFIRSHFVITLCGIRESKKFVCSLSRHENNSLLSPLHLLHLLLLSYNECTRKMDAINSFGDSLTDTGNFLQSQALDNFPVIGKLPYGETFFQKSTGRCSDGRLVVDFLAEAYGLPYLPPYLAHCKGSSDTTGKSLSSFIVGEIGGNDYNYASIMHNDIDQLKQFTPLVVEAISAAIELSYPFLHLHKKNEYGLMLIKEGAMTLLVPGNLPIGCVGIYLTMFQTKNSADYDQNGCLKAYNAFSSYHNSELNLSLKKLRSKYPNVKIIYADFYAASMQFYHTPQHHGFINGALGACCGGGGPYNFNNTARFHNLQGSIDVRELGRDSLDRGRL
ncbi:hypothetical protein V2J09_019496 [Rumex salicifolius]